jgi:hypothetical protein
MADTSLTPDGSVRHLAAVRALGVLLGSIRFDAAQPQDRGKRVLSEPDLLVLTLKAIQDIPDLSFGKGFAQADEEIRGAQVSAVLDDFVFENQVIPERVPRQLGDQPVILMKVAAIMGQDEFGAEFSLQFFKKILDLCPDLGEIAVPEFAGDDFFPAGVA